MSKKPTKAQFEVLNAICRGWELAHEEAFRCSTWMQEGKIGCGGKSRSVSSNTFLALRTRGWIKCVRRDWPSSIYHITSAGLKACARADAK